LATGPIETDGVCTVLSAKAGTLEDLTLDDRNQHTPKAYHLIRFTTFDCKVALMQLLVETLRSMVI
jgi:hypothetical protein